MIPFSFTLAEPQHFSIAEKLLLAVLIIASGALFWRRFGRVLDRILKSKKDPDFHLGTIGRRVWDFFSEVLCQSKVIRQRPLPGLAHAFVFWGFCAFALVTLNHLRRGSGSAFSRRPACSGASTSLSQPSSPWPARLASSGSSSAAFSFAPAGSATRSRTNRASSPS